MQLVERLVHNEEKTFSKGFSECFVQLSEANSFFVICHTKFYFIVIIATPAKVFHSPVPA